jgi:hypothetical protein
MRKRLDEVTEVLKQDAEKKKVSAKSEPVQLEVKEEAPLNPAVEVTLQEESAGSAEEGEEASPPLEAEDIDQQPELLAASKSSRYVPARQKKLRGR